MRCMSPLLSVRLPPYLCNGAMENTALENEGPSARDGKTTGPASIFLALVTGLSFSSLATFIAPKLVRR